MLTKEEILELREQGLPILTRRDWLNAKLRAKEHPNVFTVPTPKKIAYLKKGDYVKIGFERFAEDGLNVVVDRLWVQIDAPGQIKGCVIKFTGVLTSDPLDETNQALFEPSNYAAPSLEKKDYGLQYGDVVSLSDENIIDISWWNPEEMKWDR